MILPDYQGIGLGTKFLEAIANRYTSEGYQFSIVTSARNMIASLKRSGRWTLIRYSVSKTSTNENSIDYKRTTMRTNCKCASFVYKGKNHD